ncbi:MAG: copper amine oxidase N-terminal domain-containing protein [Eubacteriales bacterium]|nr:copper amine oxidase N-terminal domain-containing protein [Eubacteriales bacterium]
MKKIMALTLVMTMLLCSMVAFAEDALADENVMPIAEEDIESTTQEIAPEVVMASIITLQINNKTMFVDGEKIELDVPAQLVNSTTLVPMRAIFEALKAEVEWNDATQTVTANRGNKSISLQIGSKSLFVNGEEKVLDVPAQLVDTRTLVPVRAISEAFDCQVTWDEATEMVIIMAIGAPAQETPAMETHVQETDTVIAE